MMIKEVISLYKLNWKSHLWSLLIPLVMILLLKTDDRDSGLFPLMAVGFYWFNGIKFTLKKERESGIYKTNAMLPIGKKSLLLSRIIYFYLNCFIYLGLLMPFYSVDKSSNIGKSEIIWMFIVVNLLSMHQYIKFGKKKKSPPKEVRNNWVILIWALISLILGIVPYVLAKILGLLLFLIIGKRVFDDLLNSYPLNRELKEEERY